MSADKLFSGEKFVAHFSATLFLFFLLFFGGVAATRRRLQSCVGVCVCVHVRRTNMAVKRLKSWPRTKENHHRHTHTHTYERKVMNYPGYKNSNTYEREGGNSTKSRGWVSPQLSAVVLLLIDYCFPSLRKSQANGGSDAFCGHPFRTLRAYLTFIRFFFLFHFVFSLLGKCLINMIYICTHRRVNSQKKRSMYTQLRVQIWYKKCVLLFCKQLIKTPEIFGFKSPRILDLSLRRCLGYFRVQY